ncbi:endonuclease/exonuclease/phosphatase family protein, partial [Trifolium medium]|nr:endonuclease/exonuclease/phosphatase family protein [Trifolium medium]
GVIKNSDELEESEPCLNVSQTATRRGRSRKPKGRSIPSCLGVPKSIQLAEAVRGGGGKRRRNKRGDVNVSTQTSGDLSEVGGKIGADSVDDGPGGGEDCTVVSESQEGLNLEVVLPGFVPTPGSGLALIVAEDTGEDSRFDSQEASDANKLLHIQKNVGFCYDESDGEIAVGLFFLRKALVAVFSLFGVRCFVVNVYSKCDMVSKRRLWNNIIMSKAGFGSGNWCVLGDFNAVREPNERRG